MKGIIGTPTSFHKLPRKPPIKYVLTKDELDAIYAHNQLVRQAKKQNKPLPVFQPHNNLPS